MYAANYRRYLSILDELDSIKSVNKDFGTEDAAEENFFLDRVEAFFIGCLIRSGFTARFDEECQYVSLETDGIVYQTSVNYLSDALGRSTVDSWIRREKDRRRASIRVDEDMYLSASPDSEVGDEHHSDEEPNKNSVFKEEIDHPSEEINSPMADETVRSEDTDYSPANTNSELSNADSTNKTDAEIIDGDHASTDSMPVEEKESDQNRNESTPPDRSEEEQRSSSPDKDENLSPKDEDDAASDDGGDVTYLLRADVSCGYAVLVSRDPDQHDTKAEIVYHILKTAAGDKKVLAYVETEDSRETFFDVSPQFNLGGAAYSLRWQEDGEGYHTKIRMTRACIQEGYSHNEDGIEQEGDHHILITDVGVRVHIIPLEVHNCDDGFASFMYLVEDTENNTCTYGYRANGQEAIFDYHGEQMVISALWGDSGKGSSALFAGVDAKE